MSDIGLVISGVPGDLLKGPTDSLSAAHSDPEHGHMAELDENALIRRAAERFGFGCVAGELGRLQQAGWTDWLDTRLRPPITADAGASATPAPTLPTVDRVGRNATAQERKQRNVQRRDGQQAATLWWLDRMVRADDQLTERLTWFWHGHFATSAQKVKVAQLMLAQNASLRAAATGRFPDLAQAMIVDPAMLIWLDGNDNTAKAPNENLSREFMELFTLGRGHYDETDVAQAARALSGWRVNRSTGATTLVGTRHDDGAKTILGRTADFDAPSFVTEVLAAPDSPRFVLGRLWFRLVSVTPPDPAAMDRLLRAWGPSGDIRAALLAMAQEPAFRDRTSALVKQPVEWAVGLMRALGARPSTLPQRQQRRVLAGLRGMGQVPFRPPSVGGWPAGGAWLTTSAALSRATIAQAVLDGIRLTTTPVAAELTGAVPARAEGIRRLLGVEAWSDRTAQAIATVADDPSAVVLVAACSPEYAVSA